MDCKSTETDKATETRDIRLKAFSIAQGVSPGSLVAIQKQALKERSNWILVSHFQRSVSRLYARPRAYTLGYKKAFSLDELLTNKLKNYGYRNKEIIVFPNGHTIFRK